MKPVRKGNALILILLAIVVAFVASAAWYYLAHRPSSSEAQANNVAKANPSPKAQDKIAFLLRGEVWVVNEDGSAAMQLTNTSGTVDAFLYSPNYNYLAYGRRSPENLNYEVDILDLKTGQAIGELAQSDFRKYLSIPPVTVSFASLDSFQWISSVKLEVGAMDSNGAGYLGSLVIDLQDSSITPANDENEPFNQTDVDFVDYLAYPMISYVVVNQQTGVNEMHLFDDATADDKVLGTWTSSSSRIAGFAVNHAGDSIVFAEEPYLNGGVPLVDYSERIWFYENGNSTLLYTATSADGLDPSTQSMEWSRDDKYIAFDLDSSSFNPGGPTASIMIINASESGQRQQIAIDVDSRGNPSFHYLQWTTADQLIFEGREGIYKYNLQTRETSLLFASSSEPYLISPFSH